MKSAHWIGWWCHQKIIKYLPIMTSSTKNPKYKTEKNVFILNKLSL